MRTHFLPPFLAAFKYTVGNTFQRVSYIESVLTGSLADSRQTPTLVPQTPSQTPTEPQADPNKTPSGPQPNFQLGSEKSQNTLIFGNDIWKMICPAVLWKALLQLTPNYHRGRERPLMRSLIFWSFLTYLPTLSYSTTSLFWDHFYYGFFNRKILKVS